MIEEGLKEKELGVIKKGKGLRRIVDKVGCIIRRLSWE